MYSTQSVPKMVTIDPAASDDPFYRYKMPQLAITHCKNSTILNNLDNVSLALHCSSTAILKYLSTNIGTSAQVNEKSLSGKHSTDKISKLIEEFINKYVLCSSCGLPELKYTRTCKCICDKIIFECNSCGAVNKSTKDMKPAIIRLL